MSYLTNLALIIFIKTTHCVVIYVEAPSYLPQQFLKNAVGEFLSPISNGKVENNIINLKSGKGKIGNTKHKPPNPSQQELKNKNVLKDVIQEEANLKKIDVEVQKVTKENSNKKHITKREAVKPSHLHLPGNKLTRKQALMQARALVEQEERAQARLAKAREKVQALSLVTDKSDTDDLQVELTTKPAEYKPYHRQISFSERRKSEDGHSIQKKQLGTQFRRDTADDDVVYADDLKKALNDLEKRLKIGNRPVFMSDLKQALEEFEKNFYDKQQQMLRATSTTPNPCAEGAALRKGQEINLILPPRGFTTGGDSLLRRSMETIPPFQVQKDHVINLPPFNGLQLLDSQLLDKNMLHNNQQIINQFYDIYNLTIDDIRHFESLLLHSLSNSDTGAESTFKPKDKILIFENEKVSHVQQPHFEREFNKIANKKRGLQNRMNPIEKLFLFPHTEKETVKPLPASSFETESNKLANRKRVLENGFYPNQNHFVFPLPYKDIAMQDVAKPMLKPGEKILILHDKNSMDQPNIEIEVTEIPNKKQFSRNQLYAKQKNDIYSHFIKDVVEPIAQSGNKILVLDENTFISNVKPQFETETVEIANKNVVLRNDLPVIRKGVTKSNTNVISLQSTLKSVDINHILDEKTFTINVPTEMFVERPVKDELQSNQEKGVSVPKLSQKKGNIHKVPTYHSLPATFTVKNKQTVKFSKEKAKNLKENIKKQFKNKLNNRQRRKRPNFPKFPITEEIKNKRPQKKYIGNKKNKKMSPQKKPERNQRKTQTQNSNSIWKRKDTRRNYNSNNNKNIQLFINQMKDILDELSKISEQKNDIEEINKNSKYFLELKNMSTTMTSRYSNIRETFHTQGPNNASNVSSTTKTMNTNSLKTNTLTSLITSAQTTSLPNVSHYPTTKNIFEPIPPINEAIKNLIELDKKLHSDKYINSLIMQEKNKTKSDAILLIAEPIRNIIDLDKIVHNDKYFNDLIIKEKNKVAKDPVSSVTDAIKNLVELDKKIHNDKYINGLIIKEKTKTGKEPNLPVDDLIRNLIKLDNKLHSDKNVNSLIVKEKNKIRTHYDSYYPIIDNRIKESIKNYDEKNITRFTPNAFNHPKISPNIMELVRNAFIFEDESKTYDDVKHSGEGGTEEYKTPVVADNTA